jgi:AcrR family transcriptional regulator
MSAAEPQPISRSLPDSSRHDAIRRATLELIDEVGYERMTMDAVAMRAHASKATIYRRWDSKAALVVDAVECRKSAVMPMPDTGSLRGDLLEGFGALVSAINKDDLGLVTGMLAAARTDPELAQILRDTVFAKKRDAARAWIAAATARGELAADADFDLAHELAMALVFQRIGILGEPADEDFITHVVDDVLIPVLTRPSAK